MTNRTCLITLLLLATAGCNSDKQTGSKPDAKSKQGSDSKQGSGSKQGSTQSAGADSSAGQKDGSVPTDTVQIKREDQGRAGIQVAAVTVRSMPRSVSVPGQVAMDEQHTDHIGAIADGRVQSVYVLPGDTVHRGQTLAILHSHSVHDTVEGLVQAYDKLRRQGSAITYATQKRDRYDRLYSIQAASLEEKQGSEQELAEAHKNQEDAQAVVLGEREHLAELLQVKPESLNANNLYERELVPIRAVADGVVITRSVTPGQVVNTGDEAFITSNLSTVWVNAAVTEQDLPNVHVGSTVNVSPPTAGRPAFAGRVSMLGNVVDPQTRTLPVRVVVPNTGRQLRPNMFVTASIDEPATRTAIFVPSDALQDVNGFRVVFVTADGTTFQARAVKTGQQSGGMVEIVEGLQPSDHVVVNGAFMVKGELLKGTVGEG